MTANLILNFTQVSHRDIDRVGGKNASLGELIGALAPQGIAVPPGYATSADAFRLYLAHNHLGQIIPDHIAAHKAGTSSLAETGQPSARSSSKVNGRMNCSRRSSKHTGS